MLPYFMVFGKVRFVFNIFFLIIEFIRVDGTDNYSVEHLIADFPGSTISNRESYGVNYTGIKLPIDSTYWWDGQYPYAP